MGCRGGGIALHDVSWGAHAGAGPRSPYVPVSPRASRPRRRAVREAAEGRRRCCESLGGRGRPLASAHCPGFIFDSRAAGVWLGLITLSFLRCVSPAEGKEPVRAGVFLPPRPGGVTVGPQQAAAPAGLWSSELASGDEGFCPVNLSLLAQFSFR